MHHELQRFDDAHALAEHAAQFVVKRAQLASQRGKTFHFAVSGGSTPWAMFAKLTTLDVPWESFVIYQVDERIAPIGDPDRNLTHLASSLSTVQVTIQPMPVNDSDLAVATKNYGNLLPSRFDLIHLGLGPDGHTASLVPGDAVLDITDRPVATTGIYDGHQRMTLTYPALERADEILWLISGADKRRALGQLLSGDLSIPAARVTAAHSTIMADAAAI